MPRTDSTHDSPAIVRMVYYSLKRKEFESNNEYILVNNEQDWVERLQVEKNQGRNQYI